jgi:ketosteroid isomerase-like protein
MSSDNVDLVRAAYRVFDSDLEALLRMCATDIEWVSPHDAIEPGARFGQEGVRDAFAATAMAWDDTTHVAEELRDAGDKVLATVTFRGHGRGSGMDAERTEFHIWTLRGGLVARFEWYYQRDEALAAAGLAQDSSAGQRAYSDN